MRGQVTYITSAATLNEYQTNINIDINNSLLFTTFSADNGDYGLRSFSYDDSGIVTSADKDIIGSVAIENIEIDTINKLLFVDYDTKIYSYIYDTSGNMTSADCFEGLSSATNINGLCVDNTNSLLFASSDQFAALSFSYDTSGNMTSAEEYGTSAGKIDLDKEITKLFLLSAGAVVMVYYDTSGNNFVYMDSLVLDDNTNNIAIDNIRDLIFITRNINGGLISVLYNNANITTSAFSNSPGGAGYGVIIDQNRQLVINCNGVGTGYIYSYNCNGELKMLDYIPGSSDNRYIVIDNVKKLIFTNDVYSDNDPYGRIKSFSYDWDSTFYSDINNSYSDTGTGTSASPFNESQLELFLSGTSAFDGYVTSADTIRIKGDCIKSTGSNLQLFENINTKVTITSWQDRSPWSVYHISATGISGCTMISQYEPSNFSTNSADIDLIIEDGIINKPYINMDNNSEYFIFKNCIFYDNLNLSILDGSILDFNGCTRTSGDNNYYGYQLLG